MQMLPGKLGVKYVPVTIHPVTYLSFNANTTFLLLFNYHRVSMLYYWPNHVNEQLAGPFTLQLLPLYSP